MHNEAMIFSGRQKMEETSALRLRPKLLAQKFTELTRSISRNNFFTSSYKNYTLLFIRHEINWLVELFISLKKNFLQ